MNNLEMSDLKLLKYYKFELNGLCPDCNYKLNINDAGIFYSDLVCGSCFFKVSIREDLSIRELKFKINEGIKFSLYFSAENIKIYNDIYNSLNENNDSVFKLFKIARKYYENSIFE